MIEDKNQAELIKCVKNAILSMEHVSDANVEIVDDVLHTSATSFLSNEDGSEVQRATSLSEVNLAYARDREVGDYVNGHSACFKRTFADKFMGMTRFATPEEIAKYKLAKAQA